jgi:ATP-binding cassette, subfamily F, member 3
MDEPTTHLDIPSIDALVGALKSFEGTLIFISHDVYFIRALAKSVLHVHSGRLTTYAGDFDYYLEKSRATNARAALTAGFTDARPPQSQPIKAASPSAGAASAASSKPKDQSRNDSKARANEAKKLRIEVGKLEKQVSELEAKQAELTADLESPETYQQPGKAQHLNRELSAIVDQITTATEEWEKAAGRLAELEKPVEGS